MERNERKRTEKVNRSELKPEENNRKQQNEKIENDKSGLSCQNQDDWSHYYRLKLVEIFDFM